MYSSLISFTLTISFIAYGVTQLGTLKQNYNRRNREYKRAKNYLKQETCTNPRVKAELGDFNLCLESEKIMDNPPFIAAIVDTAEGLHLCGNGYCELLGHNITSSLPQIIFTLGIMALLLLWVSGRNFRRNQNEAAESYWSLPGSSKT